MFELTPYERRHQRALFNPFRDMENFEKNFWGDMAATDFKTDIKDNGKEYVLEAELPGFKKEDIHVDIEDGYMTISAERSNETEKKDDKGNFVRRCPRKKKTCRHREESKSAYKKKATPEGIPSGVLRFYVCFL